jgi:hypothetical protein
VVFHDCSFKTLTLVSYRLSAVLHAFQSGEELQQLLQALYTHGALSNLTENSHEPLLQYVGVSSRCMLERDDALEQSLRSSCAAAVTCQTRKNGYRARNAFFTSVNILLDRYIHFNYKSKWIGVSSGLQSLNDASKANSTSSTRTYAIIAKQVPSTPEMLSTVECDVLTTFDACRV